MGVMDTIHLTESAAQRILDYTARNGGFGLRLGLRKAGCSGWAYTVDMASDAGPDDVVFEDRGAKVIINQRWLEALAGTEVDFIRIGLNQRFEFRNPNVKAECGCGESIAV
ncbi:MAG: iron-sulfur cluster assembly protein IscA [Wenzhouxiangellaceae bacterium]